MSQKSKGVEAVDWHLVTGRQANKKRKKKPCMHGVHASENRLQYSLFTKQGQPSTILTHNEATETTAAALLPVSPS